MEAKIRREKSTIFYSGLAVIVFALWGSLKFFIYSYRHPEEWTEVLAEVPDDMDKMKVFAIILIILSLIDLSWRVAIGRGAIKSVSKKTKKKKIGYVFLAVFYLVLDVYSYSYAVRSAYAAPDIETMLDNFGYRNMIMLVIELTSCYAMLELIAASFRLRYYQRKQKRMAQDVPHGSID